MSSSYASERPTDAAPAPAATGWIGMVVFGGIMLLALGSFQMIEGAVAIYRDDFYLVTSTGLLLQLEYPVWGWIHLIFGLLAVVAGAGVLAGWLWARIFGVLITFLSALVHMTFLAAYPLWSAILIAMDIVIIYALTVHGGEVRRRRAPTL